MINHNKTINWKKILQGAAITAFALAPVAVATPSAQADPPDHAPAHGYRARQNGQHPGRGGYNHGYNRDDDDRDSDDDYDDDDYDDDDYDDDDDYRYRNGNNNYNNGSYQTVTGVVTNDYSGNGFTVRTNNGATLRVRAQDGEPTRLSNGDTVRLYGRYVNGEFVARTVDITNQAGENYNGGYNTRNGWQTLTGRVTDLDRNARRMTILTDGGTYTVYSTNSIAGVVNEGDTVRVYGRLNNRTVRAARIVEINNGDNYNNRNNSRNGYSYGNNINVNFPGTVVSRDQRSNTIVVRGDNGRNYTVRTKSATKVDRGDRVRIQGRTQNGVIVADKVNRQ